MSRRPSPGDKFDSEEGFFGTFYLPTDDPYPELLALAPTLEAAEGRASSVLEPPRGGG